MGGFQKSQRTLRSGITIKWIVLAPALLAPADPSHRADIGEPFAGLLAAVVIAPVTAIEVLLKVELAFFDVLFVFHGAPQKNKKLGPIHMCERDFVFS
jgi:hypothetical protein